MEAACDMEKPIGYWVQQTQSNGETIAVKVLYFFPYSDRDGGQAGDVPVKPEHKSSPMSELLSGDHFRLFASFPSRG